ncbi:MAG: NAD(P)H-hydrate dehydratase [Gammaproteobacteria bacterium]|jgi:hydroxyethylthiazole kinase-like uncharacterized protein yjeF
MSELPSRLYTAEQTRDLDRIAIEEHRMAGYDLMLRAGRAAFECLSACWPQAEHLAVLCGAGNNAGDGYVVARLARESGYRVDVLQVGKAAALKGDARRACDDFVDEGGQVLPYDGRLPGVDVIVDALFGTGLSRPVAGDYKTLIEAVNHAAAPVLSLDLPSGLGADTGMPLGAAVRADHTITFIGLKRGLLTGEGPAYCGELHFANLSVPRGVYRQVEPVAWRLSDADLAAHLGPRMRTAHKGHFGHVLIVGGESGYAGALRMAGEAALRVGAGLVSLATRAAHAGQIAAQRPELMCHGVESLDDLAPLLARATVVAVGPGLGQGDWGRALFKHLKTQPALRVIDADGLNLLAEQGGENGHRDWVLTPHPGEAGRLLGLPAAQVQADRFAAAAAIRRRYGGICVLKGAGTLVDSTARTAICDAGNPGMASGGMGDVLTGVVSGLLAQGLSPAVAAEVGVCLHARAADLAAGQGERGLLASDLFPFLRKLANP